MTWAVASAAPIPLAPPETRTIRLMTRAPVGSAVGELDDDRRVVAGALALALLAVDGRGLHPAGEGG